jgi:PAS domain S-box-containing protein
MRATYSRIGILVGFGLLLVLLAVNAWITQSEFRVQVADRDRFSHTQQVLLKLSQTESLIKDAETGQRGFLYTGDSKYLEPYVFATSHIESQLESLARLTSKDQVQQSRTVELRRLAMTKLDELKLSVSLYRSGKVEDARRLMNSGEGLSIMTEIRRMVGQMTEEETALSAFHAAEYKKSVRATAVSIYLASCVAAVGLVLLAAYILRQTALRENHARVTAEREEWFRTTLTSLGDAVIATDGEGIVTFVNPVASSLTGVTSESAEGKKIGEIFRIFNEYTGKTALNPITKVLEQGRVIGLANHTVLQRTDGSYIPIEDSAAPIRDANGQVVGVVLVFRDATRERKSQEAMRRTEKLAAAARLSATVAHEINNPLEAIGNLIYLVSGSDGLPDDVRKHLALAEEELDRVSLITRQTLGFFRESPDPDDIHMDVIVDSVLKIHRNKFLSKNITVQRDFGECPPIHGSSGELKQVIANLVSNAADATPRNGAIQVSLSCIETPTGKAVQLKVEDDGPGIRPEIKERLFEPFFTTKKDVGTGLGLWVSKEIVSRQGGSIEVHSPGENGYLRTVFKVSLPLDSIGQPESSSELPLQ